MAETPEAKVKRWLYGTTQRPGKLFEYFPKAYVYKPQGGMFGSTGAPDCMLCWNGIFVGIEIKAENGRATDLQVKHLKGILEAGGIAALLVGKDEEKLRMIKQRVLERIKSYESESTI